MKVSSAVPIARSSWARLIAVALIVVLGTTGGTVRLASETVAKDGVVVNAEFTDASPLLVGNEVKVDGVKVGVVENIALRDGKAIVAMELEPAALPVHTDARATIRPVSLLGERYIALERGAPSAPVMQPGRLIPVERTGNITDLDRVLNTIDQPTGKSMAALVAMLGEGLRGNDGNVAASIKALAPAMRDTEGLARILNDQNQLLSNVINNVQPVAEALAKDQGRTIDGLVSSAHRLLGTTSAQQKAFESMLAELPSTLIEARSALSELVSTAESTTPALRALRPTTDNLPEISGELNRFAEAADPALAQAEPVLRKAQKLLDQAQPVAAELRKAGPDLASSVTSGHQILTELTNNISGVMAFIKNWALSSNGHDGVSHYFRALVVATPQSATGALPGSVRVSKPGKLSDEEKLPDVTRGTHSLLSDKPQPNGGVTGLSPKQETDALEFLLGGQ